MTDQPKQSSRWWVLASVGVGTFMSALDGSVVNTVLPVLRRELHTSVAGIEWVTTIYLLVVSAILLGVGRAGDLHGHKRMYLGGFALFVTGSALCGLSRNVEMLIALRAFQALGASMLFANAPAILTRTFPAEQRGRALGAQGTFTYLGLTAGPSLGGWLAAAFGWRSIFYINVPVGAIGIALALRTIENDKPHGKVEPFDWTGAALFAGGLVALLTALDQGHAWGWASESTIAILAVAAALLATFVYIERRHRTPMLDLSLFTNRTFSATTISATLNYICVYSVVFIIPFLLIQGRGLGTKQAGIILTAQPIVMAILAPISGTLSDRIGSRIPAFVGMLFLAGGIVLLAMLSPAGSLGMIALALSVVGLGVGIFVSPNNSGLMGSAPRQRQGIAAGVLATARNVGMVLGVGISGAVFTTILAHGGGSRDALVRGVQASLYVAAGIALAGAIAVLAQSRTED